MEKRIILFPVSAYITRREMIPFCTNYWNWKRAGPPHLPQLPSPIRYYYSSALFSRPLTPPEMVFPQVILQGVCFIRIPCTECNVLLTEPQGLTHYQHQVLTSIEDTYGSWKWDHHWPEIASGEFCDPLWYWPEFCVHHMGFLRWIDKFMQSVSWGLSYFLLFFFILVLIFPVNYLEMFPVYLLTYLRADLLSVRCLRNPLHMWQVCCLAKIPT